jgi:glycosyltransferase involved in cell wall biosynthesis
MISIIIPCRNGANYLAEAVAGIKRQNMDVEIIVVDDGSTDNTAELARSMGCMTVSIPHSGLSAARNVGLKAAEGDFVLFHDHDDVMTDDALMRLYKTLESDPSVMFVQAQLADFVSPELPEEDRESFSPRAEPYYGLLTGSMLFREEVFAAVGGFDEKLQTGQGVEFLLRLERHGVRGEKSSFVSCMRRLHNTNMGRTMRQQENRDYAALLRAKLGRS